MSLIRSNILKIFQSTVFGTVFENVSFPGTVLFGTCDDNNSRESLYNLFRRFFIKSGRQFF